MKIGIDISQIVHEGTGVARYVRSLVTALVRKYPQHEYVLFGASLRKRQAFTEFAASLGEGRVRLVTVPLPPTVLEFLWNRWHVLPVGWFTGPIDVFWSSDWTQPPLGSIRGVTTIHDLSILKFPEESHSVTEFDMGRGAVSANIVAVHKRRLALAARCCDIFFCDSLATKKDAHALLGIADHKLVVIYPGFAHV